MEDNSFALPPLLERFENGQAVWKSFKGVDFELIGLFLSSHLIVEHYLDEYLAAYSPAPFNWGAAKLTFGQKVALLSGLKQFPEPWVIPAALKHFNSLRNKLSHDVNFVLSVEVLLPEVQFLRKISRREGLVDLDVPAKIIQEFASFVCVYLASAITYCAEQKHNGLNGQWTL
ncbi:hypothetical protein [Pseudomonas viridiflava]|uniref:hypothetical protein n=1 Tax=Pseudomonas viridiflava TaxID=33069 RepID=UPI000F028C6D|nr:hypothetical protein [Pseudomonas viridiflava]